MEIFERVIVALSHADGDPGLLRYARMVAGLAPSAVFHFVHVGDTAALPDIEAAVAEHFGTGGRVNCRVLAGHREDQLLHVALEVMADLILVGHQPSHSGRRSLARRLAMKAPCSIWLAPDGSPAELRRILVGVDFSHPSAHALSVATALAARKGLSYCDALHVYFDAAIAGMETYRVHVRGREEKAFQEFVEDLELHGVEVRPQFDESSSVPHSIARAVAATGVDLVVMGTRGLSRSASILLGSEVEQTLMDTRVPTLVIKKRGERMGFLKLWLAHGLETPGGPKFG